jgi:C4-dicarboxylate transporter DctQ subunit
MFAMVDRLSEWCGRLAGWLFVVVGAMIVYEVVARYVFLSPTIWAEELSRFFQIWATCLGGAWVLRHRHLIKIDVGLRRMAPGLRLACEIAAMVVIAIVAVVAIAKGIPIVIDSVVQGRRSATMLELPLWLSEVAVPIGYAILFLQAAAEAARLARRGRAAGGGTAS